MSEKTPDPRADQTLSTQVDLGDDLLQTRTIQRPSPRDLGAAEGESRVDPSSSRSPSPTPPTYEPVDELLLNAKILISEGLLEDAKKTLRQVLLADRGNLAARDRLEEIQKIEIKKLLGADDSTGGRYRAGGGYRGPHAKRNDRAEDASSVLEALEREIGPAKATAENELFPTDEARAAFLDGMEALCANASPQDRLDLGVAFLEMELFAAALRQFEAAAREPAFERKARGLLATALLAAGRPFDAMIEVEALVADQSVNPEDKLDYGYLGGRAQEALGKPAEAIRWYRAVLQIETPYRDAGERLLNCINELNRLPPRRP